MICENCGNEHDGSYASGRFCSKSCANTRHHTKETKEKIKNSCTTGITLHLKICPECNQEYKTIFKKQKFCSRKCSTTHYNNNNKNILSLAGLKSVQKQKDLRRSKNEIYFSDLCKQSFDNVLLNNPMFNGWDADIILEDEKIAILWNGKWHYQKITKKHSVEQVQNREKIKIKEIKIKGYTPYIIKDMGKYNKDFVENQFEIFKQYMRDRLETVPSEGS